MLEWAQATGFPSLALLIDHDDAEREFQYTSTAQTFTETEPITDVGARLGWTVVSIAQTGQSCGRLRALRPTDRRKRWNGPNPVDKFRTGAVQPNQVVPTLRCDDAIGWRIFADISPEPYGDRAIVIWHPGDAVDGVKVLWIRLVEPGGVVHRDRPECFHRNVFERQLVLAWRQPWVDTHIGRLRHRHLPIQRRRRSDGGPDPPRPEFRMSYRSWSNHSPG